ncbi:glycosyltransferase family 4 protein [Terriglobus roseus]|uniref:Glycosyltransferase involved in cell wall bisynthesis n=1 Tax=Terriglobus roseus TaxID=392734 RepID=A0A1H4TX49_9BACT|nr:glycosyltransferase family 4 protein [Terriglobus roseus]SEC61093.1 Glycosyltransferase involved in cell wall bisynthesis [Terriglobus roseus]
MKNVVIINDNARITGGADKIALQSAIGMAARGNSVTLLTAVGPIAPELRIPGIEIVSTDQQEILNDPNRLRAATQGIWNSKSARIAANLFDRLSPSDTVVHVHLWAKALSSSVVRMALDRGFQVVCTLHDYLLACPTGTKFDHGSNTICLRDPLSLQCITAQCDSRNYADKLWRIGRQVVQQQRGLMPSGLTDVIGISDLVLSVMKPHLSPLTRVHRLSNFVETQREAAADVANHSDFTFLGRMVSEKGPALFATAAKMEDVSAKFLGDGPCREEVTKILPSATISGWLSGPDSLRSLKQSRAMVFPSLWYEAQPLVVLEALSMGVPCIVPDTSAAREMVSDGRTGLIFRGGDLDNLREKIRALKDRQFAAYLGKNAYEAYWSAPCTLEKHLDGLENIYATMLRSADREIYA